MSAEQMPSDLQVVAGRCSIVIPVYNRENIVAQTIESCLAQDYPDVEVILVDDGSKDRSGDVCVEYANRLYSGGKIVRYARQANAGACVARNRGMSLATGEFLMFLDSDDLIPSEKLSRQIGAMNETGADCSICDFQIMDEAGQLKEIRSNAFRPAEFIAQVRSPSNSAIVMRRSSMPKDMQWNVNLPRMQDFDFMLRYLSGVKSWEYVPEPLYYYRVHSGARISDSYKRSLPYFEMFRSVSWHILKYPAAAADRPYLLTRYALSLAVISAKYNAARLAPRWLKQIVKMGLLKKA